MERRQVLVERPLPTGSHGLGMGCSAGLLLARKSLPGCGSVDSVFYGDRLRCTLNAR
jgi:hypothetical protein